MAAETLTYQGINRSITDYAGSRACEELINLRPTTDGLVPVRPFNVKFANSAYTRVFVHHTTAGEKYIGIKKNTSQLKVSAELIGASPAYTFFEKSFAGGGYPSSEARVDAMNKFADALSFAATGNVILFSAYEKTYSVYGNWAFMWKNSAYVETEANVPRLTVGVSASNSGEIINKTQEVPALNKDSSPAEVINAVQSAVNAVQEINPNLCLGPIIVAVAFKTNDGNTFWTDKWMVYDPLQTIGTTSPPYEDLTTLAAEDTLLVAMYEDFILEHYHGYRITDMGQGIGMPNKVDRVGFYGTGVTVSIGALSSTSSDPNYWDKETSMIQSVEVYASKPVPYFDTESAFEGFRCYEQPGIGGEYYTILLVQKDYEDMELGAMQLYHQASIPMESLLGGGRTVELKFGGNLQVTSETLRVDAGAVTRYGKILSYNSRFHYYDSVARTEVGKPSFVGLHGHAFQSSATYIFVRHSDESGTRLLYMGSISGEGYISADITIAPSVNIKEVILYSKFTREDHAMYYESVCRMTASGAYNFSIGMDRDWDAVTGSGTKAEYEALITANKPPVVVTPEPAAINVTEQYNPFVFRVEHSYLAPGNVIDVVPQNYVVTDATYGREPIDVFTTQGVFALIQGGGDILYSWFDPISPMIASGRAVPTEAGVFFLSGGSLYLCAGHRTTLVSDALMAGPHKYVRSAGPNGAYAKIAGGSGVVDMSSFVSAVDFETFCAGGRLSYNRFRQEVYVSNNSYAYSYVLSLKYRQWFKAGESLWQDEPASVIAARWSATSGIDYLDLGNEDDGRTEIHLQTRPFSMGYQYAHVHRLVSMVSASLSSTYGDVLVAHLYGSDDLRSWTLLAYARRNGANPAMHLSQIRTPTAARSWRYYTVCLTGKVYAGMVDNTDIGPFIVDYDPVVRRIG